MAVGKTQGVAVTCEILDMEEHQLILNCVFVMYSRIALSGVETTKKPSSQMARKNVHRCGAETKPSYPGLRYNSKYYKYKNT
ncbi:hypothetical protein C5167_025095 [Papaver somniferum]|uniref:Uncharacterized protein n=1 Tax=Papaver somniferum TaxID=3469 RepID=A0A4Y7JQF6_PAPSO|nr:hypothetical protein C5167_025095 [Papaver somniferum]